MKSVLRQKFFERPTVIVAKDLLGKFLVRRVSPKPPEGGRVKNIACMIVETEAYDGFKDKASHAHRGKTMRNAVMFGEAGYWYVYFTYGMHYMLNIVTGKRGYPAAVLIRGAVCGDKLLNGPAKLTKFLKIDKGLNALRASPEAGLWIEDKGLNALRASPEAGLWIEDRGLNMLRMSSKGAKSNALHSPLKGFKIERTPRIGVQYAGKWAEKPYRFVLKQSGAREK